MKKLRTVNNEPGRFNWYCPGCEGYHGVWTEVPNPISGGKWDWNGSMDKPTFKPSLLIRYPHAKGYSNENPAPAEYKGEYVEDICHCFITNGMIQYLADCTHKLAGQTVELPDTDLTD